MAYKKVAINTIPKALLEDALRCKEDKMYFFTTHCQSYNADTNRYELCPDYQYLRDTIDYWDNNPYTVLLKARQLTISTLNMFDSLHFLLFANKGSRRRVIARKEAQIFDGTADSLYGRLLAAHARLPDHLRQAVEVTKRPITIKTARGVMLLGESTTSGASRGGTSDITDIDEYAFLGNMAGPILASVMPNSQRVKVFSTPLGRNAFYNLYANPDNKFVPKKLLWNVHPERDAEWFAARTAGLTKAQIAQEYLCEFDASQTGVIFDYDPAAILSTGDVTQGRLIGGVDYGLADDTALVWGLQHPLTTDITMLGSISVNNMLPEAVFGLLKTQLEKQGLLTLLKTSLWFGDPSGENRQIGLGSSVAQEYRDLGLPVEPAGRSHIIDRIREIQRRLGSLKIRFGKDAQNILITLSQAHYPTTADGIIKSTERWADSTEGATFNCHLMDAISYLVIGTSNPIGTPKGVEIINPMHALHGTPAQSRIPEIANAYSDTLRSQVHLARKSKHKPGGNIHSLY